MKPKPRLLSNHLTLPLAITYSFHDLSTGMRSRWKRFFPIRLGRVHLVVLCGQTRNCPHFGQALLFGILEAICRAATVETGVSSAARKGVLRHRDVHRNLIA